MWLRSWAASVPGIPPPVHTEDEVRAWFEEVVLPKREVWVVDHGGAVLALLVLENEWIDQLYVEPGHTGRGIGGRLMAVAKRQRPSLLRLWTFEANVRARHFYERHGFVCVRLDGRRQRGGHPGRSLRVVAISRRPVTPGSGTWSDASPKAAHSAR